MIYLIPETGQWRSNAKDAKALGDYVAIETPTTKAAWLELLNEHQVGAKPAAAAEDPAPVPTIEPDAPGAVNADAMLEWLFDQAEPRHVERIFEALGTRFHEMRKVAEQ